MNNTFDFQRFGMLLKKDFRSTIKQYGTSILVFILLPILMMAISLALHRPHNWGPELRVMLMGFFLAGVMSIAPSKIFHNVNRGNAGIYFATLPASKLEKYMSMMIICLIIVPILYLVGAVAVDMLLSLFPRYGFDCWLWESNPIWEGLLASTSEAKELGLQHWNMGTMVHFAVISYISTALFFMLTNTYYKKNKWVMSILTLIALNFIVTLIEIPFMGDVSSFVQNIFRNDITKIDVLSIWMQIIGWVFNIGIAVWLYFRLKKITY